MPDWLDKLILAFIPLFVAIDPLGAVPFYLNIAQGADVARRRRVTNQATTAAAVVAISFMFLGKWTFSMLGVTVSDFQIAGGLVLLALSGYDLVIGPPPIMTRGEDFGVVPLGLPIIVGPATLTSLIIVSDTVGAGYALVALLLNLLIVNFSFRYSDRLANLIGLTGLRAVSKITSLLLAAIAVSMIRRGVQTL